jgi:hypothetical protein
MIAHAVWKFSASKREAQLFITGNSSTISCQSNLGVQQAKKPSVAGLYPARFADNQNLRLKS